MLAAFNTVKAEADKRGVQVLESELIGMVPLQALTQVAAQALWLPKLSADQVIEMKVFGE
jgi:glutamate formiminotransferase